MLPSFIYGTAWKKENTAKFTLAALRAGFRAVDTANQAKHYTEPLVGDALKAFYSEGHSRTDIFLQTKFTSIDGQDHRVPYEPSASLTDQVHQSFASSLEHLHTDYLDSFVLHGPLNFPSLGDEDFEVWAAMESLHFAGKTKAIGISNVILPQLELLCSKAKIKPAFVQNRCFANRGWDYPVRKFCRENNIAYQGFSLLTANPLTLNDPGVKQIAQKYSATPAQIVFAFARGKEMIPLTGTTSPEHLTQDLKAMSITLSGDELDLIETCEL